VTFVEVLDEEPVRARLVEILMGNLGSYGREEICTQSRKCQV
jgi:hypothetical protein